MENLNTSQVTDMEGMFEFCDQLTSLDVWHFDTRKVERMSWLFYMCVALKTIYCRDSWTCRSSEDMFKNCFSLRGAIAYDESKTNAKYANLSTGYFTNSRKGDIDDNGDVNVSDVTALINVILGN